MGPMPPAMVSQLQMVLAAGGKGGKGGTIVGKGGLKGGEVVKGGGKGGGFGGGGDDKVNHSGVVKHFNVEKGYGFISSPSVPAGDAYFKSAEPLAIGQSVAFKLRYMPDGKPQAHEVCRAFEAGEEPVGQIRSYNQLKGFGFIKPDGKPQDIYFKKEELPEELRELSADDLVGCTVHCTVGLQKDGKPVGKSVLLMAWADPATKRPAAAMGAAPEQWAAKRLRVDAQAAAGETYDGVVRSFNPNKGFGFVRPESLPSDVYFNSNALPEAYRYMDLTGATLRFALHFTPDGKPQANSLEVVAPAS